MSNIKDINLAPSGEHKIEWVRRNCPLLRGLEEDFSKTKPFKGIKVALSVHLEAKTAYLCKVLAAGGAEMYITGSNPLSTQDDVAAALVKAGLEVFAWYDCTAEEYDANIEKVLENHCNIIIDDGGDLVHMLNTKFRDCLPDVIGGCEETTTGILRLKALAKEDKLEFPMVLVNDADCKHLFDNRYGTGQSVWDGINRTTNLIVAGKSVVVAGYGWCGKGVAMRAKGLGAKVIVTEVDAVKAIEAVMDGFEVMTMREAAKIGDFFVTVTGCKDVITPEDFKLMKNGAIMCNAGHFDVEVDVAGLKKMAINSAKMRNNIIGYEIEKDKWLYVLGEGRLVNLACGDGHPAEIMDMSFAIQALSAKYLVEHKGELNEKLIKVPEVVDKEVARRKLSYLGVEIDTLSKDQEEYLFGVPEQEQRVKATKIQIDMNSVKSLYAERSFSRASVDVDAPVVLASDSDPKHIREWNEYEVEHWLPCLSLDENSNVLEVGFGTGRIAKYIIEKAGKYVGVDYVEEFAETAKKRKDIKPAYDFKPIFLSGSFKEMTEGKVSLPLEKFNRFVISGGVLMYINDDEVKEDLSNLLNLLTDDAIIYISEPIALSERLTLNSFYSENMKANYSAIYRTVPEYMELFKVFLDKGFKIVASEEFFKDDIKGQKETRQWMFIMKK